jgi:hypothetical protein
VFIRTLPTCCGTSMKLESGPRNRFRCSRIQGGHKAPGELAMQFSALGRALLAVFLVFSPSGQICPDGDWQNSAPAGLRGGKTCPPGQRGSEFCTSKKLRGKWIDCAAHTARRIRRSGPRTHERLAAGARVPDFSLKPADSGGRQRTVPMQE